MRRVVIVLIAAVLTTAACNTVQGIGKDIQRGGEVLEGAATKK